MTTVQQAPLGVFGGSGFYEFLEGAQEIAVDTPFGPPAAPIVIGTVAGNSIAFMARHGRAHEFAAHRVPYRANMWAMHSVGVRSIVTPCSVGSLQPDIHPGQLVVIDQLVDRTWGRPDTFHDVGGPTDLPGTGGQVHHQSFAHPYDAKLRALLVAAGRHRLVSRHTANGFSTQTTLLGLTNTAWRSSPGPLTTRRRCAGWPKRESMPSTQGDLTSPAKSSTRLLPRL